jgi:hypothetical protein
LQELRSLRRAHDRLQEDFEHERKEYKRKLDKLERDFGKFENGNKKRLDLCIANSLIHLVDKLRLNDKTPQGDEHSTHRSVQFAANLDNSYLQKHGVPSKYWPYIGNLSKVY